jgi:integrase
MLIKIFDFCSIFWQKELISFKKTTYTGDIMPKFINQVIEVPTQFTQEGILMEDFAKIFLEQISFQKKPEHLQEDQKLLQNIILPTLGQMTVQDIVQSHIEALHARLREMPYQANRVLSLLKKMFSIAISWSWREDNPALGIVQHLEEKPNRELNQEEFDRLWAVLESYPTHLAAYLFKLLLLTEARKKEVLSATWDQFDLEKGVWTKPSHLTKQEKTKHLPLSNKALDILQNLKKLNSQNSKSLFPEKLDSDFIENLKLFWKKVLKEANLENMRIYDLRHTHTLLVSNGWA